MNEIRWDLVAHVREQIEAGTYDTDGKLRIVVERLVEGLYGPCRPELKADSP